LRASGVASGLLDAVRVTWSGSGEDETTDFENCSAEAQVGSQPGVIVAVEAVEANWP
jgi:hypothetical protein